MTSSAPYVVIDIDAPNTNVKPFAGVLTETKDSKAKTLHNTFFYVFRATFDGTTYWKIGQTYLAHTYHSKQRFNPVVEYKGVVQVLHYGKMFEALVIGYLNTAVGKSYKGTEWYANAGPAIERLLAAIRANANYLAETPHVMVNIEDFPVAFTCGARAKADAYLTLFRVRYKGKLYELSEHTVQGPLRHIIAPPAAPPAAPAPPASNDDDNES